MKIYIVGSVASGKTTLGNKMTSITGIECIHLDEIVHYKNSNDLSSGNTRRSMDEIEVKFSEVLNREKWIVEDSGRIIFDGAMEESDMIIHLCPSTLIRKKRIVLRYLKQKIGFEDSNYRPSLKMVKMMFNWTTKYDDGTDNLKNRLEKYNDKVVELESNKDVITFINKMKRM